MYRRIVLGLLLVLALCSCADNQLSPKITNNNFESMLQNDFELESKSEIEKHALESDRKDNSDVIPISDSSNRQATVTNFYDSFYKAVNEKDYGDFNCFLYDEVLYIHIRYEDSLNAHRIVCKIMKEDIEESDSLFASILEDYFWFLQNKNYNGYLDNISDKKIQLTDITFPDIPLQTTDVYRTLAPLEIEALSNYFVDIYNKINGDDFEKPTLIILPDDSFVLMSCEPSHHVEAQVNESYGYSGFFKKVEGDYYLDKVVCFEMRGFTQNQ